VNRLVAAIAEEAFELWEAPSQDPALIIQNGGLWASLEPTQPLRSPGYGQPAKIVGDSLHLNPQTARRIRASKLMETDKSLWEN